MSDAGSGIVLVDMPTTGESAAGGLVAERLGRRFDGTDAQGWSTVSNRAGGIEGGISNGEPIIMRAAAAWRRRRTERRSRG